ncbi:glycoside hydrolase family 16 protein [Periconia macrospinosa]|uniref:endo-1,3(4)-beta-glucanase n=1 Tax=Periconia macrospinosa TaxID=97972 RepID=A0A2V1DS52_9PLEO|nr:glycoside hydrolase family 16 protein [Periconia macrospinosa]
MASLHSPDKSPASEKSTQVGLHGSPKAPEDETIAEGKTTLNPKPWPLRTWILIGIVLVIVVIGAIVGGVLGARANAYPDYYRIEYSLKDAYEGNTFFDKFDYFSDEDPTHGFVEYMNSTYSTLQQLTRLTSTPERNSLSPSGTAILRVDNTTTNATDGRRSVRITSRPTYSTGLFIFDIHHSPYGCATWPAVWLSDIPNWPTNGEIDVVEAVNMGDTGNQMTLHTTQGCEIGRKRRRRQTGEALTYDCWNATDGNVGCGVQGEKATYGKAFNAQGGGVYAVELRDEGIRVWMFDRSNIPADIVSRTPDPSTWETALADFPNLECDIERYFKDLSIVVNISLCGDWAGQDNVFGANPVCKMKGKCEDFVKSNPGEFDEAYWEFGGFWVYQGV